MYKEGGYSFFFIIIISIFSPFLHAVGAHCSVSNFLGWISHA